MTCSEFLSTMQSRGAKIYAPAHQNQILLLNGALQQRRYAILPQSIKDMYTLIGAINLDTGYIFGPNEILRDKTYPIPSILKVNDDISILGKTVGKTIFGRNDLFWFAFDAFGTFYMLDNLNLTPLRRYDNMYNAITDCLISGKI
jgi:hypothetical protein